jgi:hypothetical protein
MNNATGKIERLILYQQNLDLIVLLQARIKGYLVRKSMNDRLHYLNQHTEEIIRIQVIRRVF